MQKEKKKNNYLKKFWQTNEKQALGSSATALYFFILYLWKKNNYKEVEISEYKLTSSLKLARQTIHIAKKQLAKAQLISYSTKVGFAAKFKILSDIENKSSITKDFLKSIDSVPEEENNLGYPSFHEFIKYTETLDLYSDELYEKVEIQYHNWQDANWKNALGRPILDWKKLIKNKLPFFRNSVEK
jgi:hypothetical protein